MRRAGVLLTRLGTGTQGNWQRGELPLSILDRIKLQLAYSGMSQKVSRYLRP
jgi:hypothetical protein